MENESFVQFTMSNKKDENRKILNQSFKSEIVNFFSGFSMKALWLHLTDQSITSRFRGSRLGAWWLVLSQIAFAGVAGTIWVKIFGLEISEFVPFIAISFAVWAFISGVMLDACASLIIAGGYLKQMPLPLSIFIFRGFLAQCFYLLIGVVVTLALFGLFKRPIQIGALWAIPGTLLVMFSLFWISVIFAFLGARYRDFSHGVSNILQVVYVVSPVIYPPEFLAKKGYVIFLHLNPLAGFIDLIRNPLMKGTPSDWQYYAMVAAIGIIAMILSLLAVSRWGRKVVYWL